MTQLFHSKNSTPTPEKQRTIPMPTNKQNAGGSHFPQKFKNFFRINSLGNHGNVSGQDGASSPNKADGNNKDARKSRFLGMTRNRSVTVNSEGNPLDDVSPTAHANPYFAHQGPPALRHHNEGSVPPSPPDTPPVPKITGGKESTTANKEELARKLRRVASAPNAQGMFSKDTGDNRPQTAEMGKEPLVQDDDASISMVDQSGLLGLPANGSVPTPGQIRENANFRRTYSSNSIKVRNVEVGPASFDKIKLIGKGDVGKVYLVREKKSSRLYAMNDAKY
jgi:protein-serine/threonine kinase